MQIHTKWYVNSRYFLAIIHIYSIAKPLVPDNPTSIMPSFTPKDLSIAEFQFLMQGAIAPRPIAFASTINAKGQVNLSPFSYFNCFSSNPPILVFSPARRVRDNTTKHTLENVYEVPEVVVNVVTHGIVEQTSLASTEYEQGIDEFVKAGLTALKSEIVTPPRVAESPVQFECKVNEIKVLGDGPGAGNMIICEVLKMHINDAILEDSGKFIDPNKIDLVSRLGGAWYGRASGNALFTIPKPLATKGIGFDALPKSLINSSILTGNQLARLANIEAIPSLETKDFPDIKTEAELHHKLAEYISKDDINTAWQLILHHKLQ
jgi:flavin reductase (DIM6/NTAB) family NADH-FMN oxidoreductase RutF